MVRGAALALALGCVGWPASVLAQEEVPPPSAQEPPVYDGRPAFEGMPEGEPPPPAEEPPPPSAEPAPEPPAEPERRPPANDRDRPAFEEEPTPTPDEPGDIPPPKGYAPDIPQPFLHGPLLFLVQLTAGLGARTLANALSWVPLLGLVAIAAAPLAEAAALTVAGDRMGPWRASLFWPAIASYIVSAIGVTAASVLWLMGLGSMGVALPLLFAGGPLATLAYVGAGLLVGGAAVIALGGAVWIAGSIASAVASLIAYHLTRRPKHPDDNGTDLPRLLPRGKGIPVPFFEGGEEPPEDENQEDRGALPVSHEEVRP